MEFREPSRALRYEQLADELSGMIAGRILRPGERLPSVRRLSQEKKLSISTVLQALREEFGSERVEVLGIALDEADAVRKYVGEMGIDYPILLASMSDFGLMRAYGNDRDALPFTVIVDAQGRLHTRKLGEYHENDLRADIEAALAL